MRKNEDSRKADVLRHPAEGHRADRSRPGRPDEMGAPKDRERPQLPSAQNRQNLGAVGRVASLVRTTGIFAMRATSFTGRPKDEDAEVNSSPWGVGEAVHSAPEQLDQAVQELEKSPGIEEMSPSALQSAIENVSSPVSTYGSGIHEGDQPTPDRMRNSYAGLARRPHREMLQRGGMRKSVSTVGFRSPRDGKNSPKSDGIWRPEQDMSKVMFDGGAASGKILASSVSALGDSEGVIRDVARRSSEASDPKSGAEDGAFWPIGSKVLNFAGLGKSKRRAQLIRTKSKGKTKAQDSLNSSKVAPSGTENNSSTESREPKRERRAQLIRTKSKGKTKAQDSLTTASKGVPSTSTEGNGSSDSQEAKRTLKGRDKEKTSSGQQKNEGKVKGVKGGDAKAKLFGGKFFGMLRADSSSNAATKSEKKVEPKEAAEVETEEPEQLSVGPDFFAKEALEKQEKQTEPPLGDPLPAKEKKLAKFDVGKQKLSEPQDEVSEEEDEVDRETQIRSLAVDDFISYQTRKKEKERTGWGRGKIAK